MNYLAHAFLSNNDKDFLIGNFIADHIRGNDFSAYPEKVIQGIHLHRKIDTFTDKHPLFKASKRLFYDGFEKHSGVLVDIYFDHLLAKNFENFHHQPLSLFAERVYEVYNTHQHLLPNYSSRFLNYLIQNNIYNAYAQKEGIERVLFHLSERINHGVRLDQSLTLFTQNEKEIQQHFQSFFTDAIKQFGTFNL